MGYMSSTGRWANTLAWTPIAAGTVLTTSGSSDVFENAEYTTARLTIAVSVASGTIPTLDFRIMTCDTKGGTFVQVGAFGTFSAAGSQREAIGNLDRFVRLDWYVAGTNPSFTVGTDGEVA